MRLKNKNILLVEDDLFLGKMLMRLLKVEGAKSDWAQDGEEALDKLKNDTFDLIIADLMMPKMDGRELIKRVKADEKTKDIPIIVLTNLISSISTKDELEEIKNSGISGLFVKSNTHLSDLVDRVVNLLKEA
ncbi:response regulator [Patescibacteria group bacterium]|nr:response regulator [Patescibacteria group bacterium]